MQAQKSRYSKNGLIFNYSDPSQPDYRPIWWQQSVEHWQKTLHWTGPLDDPDFKNLYLTTVPGELTPNRAARVQATNPEPFFKDAVKDHASIFGQFEIAPDAPQSLIDNQDNVDLAGADLWQWSLAAFNALFRDGAAMLGCLTPKAETEKELREDRRPRLLWVPMRDVFWPEYREYDGVKKLAKISIRRGHTKQIKKGDLLLINSFWVYELNDQQQCYVTVWTENDKGKLIEGSAAPIKGSSGKPLTRLPFTDKLSFINGIELTEEQQLYSPFADILNLNCEHFNARSEYNAVKQKTALPTPTRYWPNGVPENPPPFYAGPGRCIEMPSEGRVEYLELRGASLPELRADLDRLEAKIAIRDNKLFHVGDGTRSATEASIENQKAKVGMPGIKRMIESAYQDLFSIWEAYESATPGPVGGITISEQALSSPPDSQSMIAALSGVDRGLPIAAIISKLIRDGHYKPEDFEGTQIQPIAPLNLDEVIQ